MTSKKKSQNGVALISVLLVVSLLSWVISYFIVKTQEQVELIGLLEDRVFAEIEADSLVDEMIFRHLTQTYKTVDNLSDWNYRGVPINLDANTQISLQDTQGKLSLINLNEKIFKNFLQNNGMENRDVDRLIDCLADWQDKDDFKRLNGDEMNYYSENNLTLPRNDKIQSISEFSLVCGFPKTGMQKQIILDNFLFYIVGAFNPIFASKELLKGAYLSAESKRILEDLIDSKKIERAQQMFSLDSSGLSAMNMQLSKDIQLKVSVRKGAAEARRDVVFSYNIRYKPRPPLQFWHWSE